MLLVKILAVDPGTATGFAYWSDGECSSWTMKLHHALDDCNSLIADSGTRPDAVISESFTITQRTLKASRDGQNSIEGIGVLRWLCHLYAISFSTVSPSEAVSFSTNDKLKRAGLYVPQDHERSARRVLLVALVKTGAIDARSLLDPS